MKEVANEIILASAGTGKTFALSNRIVRLLAEGVAPETIVALTFTRKAAAEFMTAVVQKLAAAAEGAREAGLPDFPPAAAGETLARFIHAMDRVPFGTLDSFFQRVVSSFPFELGLPGSFEIVDAPAGAELRRRVLAKLFRPGEATTAAHRAMLAAFRQATWGTEEKNLERSLNRFIDECHELYLSAPEASRWGSETAIWPGGCAAFPVPEKIGGDLAIVREWLASEPRCDRRLLEGIEKLLAHAEVWQPGMKLPKSSVLVDQVFSGIERLPRDPTLLYQKKRVDIGLRVAQALATLARRYVGATIRLHLDRTQGIRQVLADYEEAYEREARATGRLSFADVTHLLGRSETLDWQFRLDSRLAHWLFDEFQDTSLTQWQIVEPLVDEVLQDPTGSRSVFFVGDGKQSIYRWRGGNHRLIADLATRYRSRFTQTPLDKSFRSTGEIIDIVNAVGQTICAYDSSLPEKAVAEWRAAWRPHETSDPAAVGYCCVRAVDDAGNAYASILETLLTVEPAARGMACAILMRSNADCRALAAWLRERDFLEVVSETDESVMVDNPVTRAVLALFSAVIHPGDSASKGLVEMTPLGGWAEANGGWERARIRLLNEVAESGFEETIRRLFHELGDAVPADAFSRRRIEQLLQLSRAYDAGPEKDWDAFVRFLTQQTRRDSSVAGKVQITTVHKSKGLGYDMVILPLLDGTRLDAASRDRLMVHENAEHEPEWILDRPSQLIAGQDPVLRAAFEEDRARQAYEEFCVLYVSLTRARRGLYILAGKPGANGESISPVRVVRDAVASLGQGGEDSDLLWQRGNPDWHTEAPQAAKDETLPRSKPDWDTMPSRGRLIRLRPSESEAGGMDPSSLLFPRANQFGLEVHAAFAEIEWLDGNQLDRITAEAAAEIQKCLAAPEIAAFFRKPTEFRDLWRERAFDLILDGRWLSGVFDRVVIAGNSATVIDFKTDRAGPEHVRTRHASQLNLYRNALASLTGMPQTRIRACIVHTATQTVLEITDGRELPPRPTTR